MGWSHESKTKIIVSWRSNCHTWTEIDYPLRIQVCPKFNGFSLQSCFGGWDFSTINPTNFREGSGFLGVLIYCPFLCDMFVPLEDFFFFGKGHVLGDYVKVRECTLHIPKNPDPSPKKIPNIRRIDGRICNPIEKKGHRMGSGKSRILRTYKRILRVTCKGLSTLVICGNKSSHFLDWVELAFHEHGMVMIRWIVN